MGARKSASQTGCGLAAQVPIHLPLSAARTEAIEKTSRAESAMAATRRFHFVRVSLAHSYCRNAANPRHECQCLEPSGLLTSLPAGLCLPLSLPTAGISLGSVRCGPSRIAWDKAACSSFKYESEPSGSVDLYILILGVVPPTLLNFRRTISGRAADRARCRPSTGAKRTARRRGRGCARG